MAATGARTSGLPRREEKKPGIRAMFYPFISATFMQITLRLPERTHITWQWIGKTKNVLETSAGLLGFMLLQIPQILLLHLSQHENSKLRCIQKHQDIRFSAGFAECADHNQCPGQAETILPTRVIEVAPVGSPDRPRLLVTFGKKGRYAALSYCGPVTHTENSTSLTWINTFNTYTWMHFLRPFTMPSQLPKTYPFPIFG